MCRYLGTLVKIPIRCKNFMRNRARSSLLDLLENLKQWSCKIFDDIPGKIFIARSPVFQDLGISSKIPILSQDLGISSKILVCSQDGALDQAYIQQVQLQLVNTIYQSYMAK